jgi:hypothetical protein
MAESSDGSEVPDKDPISIRLLRLCPQSSSPPRLALMRGGA